MKTTAGARCVLDHRMRLSERFSASFLRTGEVLERRIALIRIFQFMAAFYWEKKSVNREEI